MKFLSLRFNIARQFYCKIFCYDNIPGLINKIEERFFTEQFTQASQGGELLPDNYPDEGLLPNLPYRKESQVVTDSQPL